MVIFLISMIIFSIIIAPEVKNKCSKCGHNEHVTLYESDMKKITQCKKCGHKQTQTWE